MKRRKNLIIAFLLVASLALSIGYAALTDVLDIMGVSEISIGAAQEAFNQDVYFSAVSSGEGYTASIDASNNDLATFTIDGFEKAGDVISVTLTIKNDSEDYEADVTPSHTNTNAEYFQITSDWASQMQTIPAGGEKTITLSVKLLKLPADEGVHSATIDIELTAVTGDAVNP